MAVYEGPIVDVDVHHLWLKPAEVIQYLPEKWRVYAEADPARLWPPGFAGHVNTNHGRMTETLEPNGTRGTEYATMCRTLLDRYNYYRVVLTYDVGQHPNQMNPEFGNALATAMNQWNIEHWLSHDERLYSMVAIRNGSPVEAAKEIRRVADHPRIVSVCMAGNPLGRPFGDPIYDPIYEAAEETGLHLALHYGGSDRNGTNTTLVGGGLPIGLLQHSQFSQQAMHYISSFIVNGTFEKFPNLKVLIKEYGIAWLPSVMTRLDNDYALLKAESSHVKKLPSEYIREHVKLSTQPIEEGPSRRSLVQLLETIDDVEDLLCFSTDWPHWSADEPSYVARVLPNSWHRKVFCDNAADMFGFPRPEDVGWEPPQAAAAGGQGLTAARG